MKATAKAGACTTSAVKGQKLRQLLNAAILRCWRCVAGGDGHPCYGCNEEGIGFHKGIHRLPTSKTRLRVHRNRMLTLKRRQCLGRRYWFARRCGWAGCGVSVMAVRELGRQQKKDNAAHGENNREQT